MKHIIFIFVLSAFLLTGCESNVQPTDVDSLNTQIEELQKENEQLKKQIENSSESNVSSNSQSDISSSSQEKSSSSTKSTVSFTNKFGTATTICAHIGCSNYIASSGDTNCCTTHSKRCLECNAYIDEDAAWCMSCLEKTVNAVKNK